MRCTLFSTLADFDNQVDEIQDIEQDFSYQYKVSLISPKKATATVTQNDSGTITAISLYRGKILYHYTYDTVQGWNSNRFSNSHCCTIQTGVVSSITWIVQDTTQLTQQ